MFKWYLTNLTSIEFSANIFSFVSRGCWRDIAGGSWFLFLAPCPAFYFLLALLPSPSAVCVEGQSVVLCFSWAPRPRGPSASLETGLHPSAHLSVAFTDSSHQWAGFLQPRLPTFSGMLSSAWTTCLPGGHFQQPSWHGHHGLLVDRALQASRLPTSWLLLHSWPLPATACCPARLSYSPRGCWPTLPGHLSEFLSPSMGWNHSFSEIWTVALGRATPHLMSSFIRGHSPSAQMPFRVLFTYLWLSFHYNEYHLH